VRFFEPGDYCLVKDFSCGVNDFGESGLGWGEGVTEFQQGFGYGSSCVAGEADDADATAAWWGGDGYDGVFEFGIEEVGHGFSYGNGRKICWGGGDLPPISHPVITGVSPFWFCFEIISQPS
jgi:hypothetical protein